MRNQISPTACEWIPRTVRHLRPVLFAFAVFAIAGSSLAQVPGGGSLSVAATFIRMVEPPGADNGFLRPSAIYSDHRSGEILVVDSGNNRVVILDEEGTYRFSFLGNERIGSIADIAVDSQGFIHVLGGGREGNRIMRLDFDGEILDETAIPRELDGEPIEIRSFDLDADDRFFLLDGMGMRVIVCDGEGSIRSSFQLAASGLNEEARQDLIYGSITVAGDLVVVPEAMAGEVLLFNRTGKRIRSFGQKGNNIGDLNFPVETAVVDGRLLLVLDKHRFNVVCFDLEEGRFVGEFGGKGSQPGWFYHPSLLAVDGRKRVYIGQGFQNRVQVCAIPTFIADATQLGDTDG